MSHVAKFSSENCLDALETKLIGTPSQWRDAHETISRLTQRQLEVFTSAAEGLSTKEIARVLDISPRNVEVHRTFLGQKMGTTSGAKFARVAIHAKLFRRLMQASNALSILFAEEHRANVAAVNPLIEYSDQRRQ